MKSATSTDFQWTALVLILALYAISLLIPPATLVSGTVVFWGHLFHRSHLLYASGLGLALVLAVLSGASFELRAEWPLYILTLSWLLSFFWSVDHKISMQSTTSLMLKGPIAGWVVFKCVRRCQECKMVFRVVVGLTLVVAVIGLLSLFHLPWSLASGPLELPSRIFGSMGHPIALGSILVFGLPLALTSWGTKSNVGALVGSFLITTLAFTISRSSMIACLFILPMLVIYIPNAWQALKKVLLGALLLILGVGLVVSHQNRRFFSEYVQGAKQRLSVAYIINPNQTTAELKAAAQVPFPRRILYNHRVACYVTTLRMMKSCPLLGFGLGNYLLQYDKYRIKEDLEIFGSPDNMFLRLTAETGILGLSTWIIFLWGWLKMSSRRAAADTPFDKDLRTSLLIAVAGLLINSLFFDSFYWNACMMSLAIGMGLAAAPWPDRQGRPA
jgi:hypothetical protein